MARRLKLNAELSQREEEIVRLTAAGKTAKEIGDRLYMSPHTVNNIVREIYSKTSAKKNTELSVFYFCRKFKVTVLSALSCAILLMAMRPFDNGDMRRYRVRVRIETETRTVRTNVTR